MSSDYGKKNNRVPYGNMLLILVLPLLVSLIITISIGIAETAKNIEIQKKQALAFASSLAIVLERRQDLSAPLNFFSGASFKYLVLSKKEPGIPAVLPHVWYDDKLIKVAISIFDSSQVLLLELPLINPFPYSAILVPLAIQFLLSFIVLAKLLLSQAKFAEELAERTQSAHPSLIASSSGFFSPFLQILSKPEQAALERIAKTDSKLQITRSKLETYELITDHMQEAIILVDKKLKISYANPAARKLLNMPPAPAGKPLALFLKNNKVLETLQKSHKTKKSYRYEFCYDKQQQNHLEISITPLLNDPEEENSIIVIRDISSIKRLQNLRKDFVSNVSHELKTPISSIIGYTETIKDLLADTDSTAARFIDTVHNNAIRLSNIVEDLLLLSRIEQGNSEIKKTTLSLMQLAEKAINTVKRTAEEKNITIRITAEKDHTISANAGLMTLAIGNILDNAVKYCPPQSQVTIDWHTDSTHTTITITDNGPGIPQQSLPRIFERFYRVESSRNRNTGGTGLGLAIVKHIIESHNGSIQAQSPQEGGTRFIIQLKNNQTERSTLAP